MRKNSSKITILCLLMLSYFELYSIKPEEIRIIISEDKTVLSDWEIPENLDLETLESKIGASNRKVEEEENVKYIWDSLGIVLRLNKKTKNTDKLTVFYTNGSEKDEPKKKFPGKINFYSSDPNQKIDAIYKGWICKFTLGRRSLYGICDRGTKNLEQLDLISR